MDINQSHPDPDQRPDRVLSTDEQLRRQNEELTRLVAELQAANQETAEARRDASDQKEEAILSHESLVASEARTREILERIGDIFYALDKDYNFTYVNNKAEEAWNVKREELVGRYLWEVFPQAKQSESERMHRQVMESRQTLHFETVSPVLKRWISVSIFPSASGGLSVYFHDIEARKQSEEALKASEARFRTLSDALPQLIWTNEAEGKAVYFNQRWFDYTGLTYEQSAGPGWQAVVHPDDERAASERWQEALTAGQVFDTEYRLRRYDGTYRWHIGRNVPYRDDAGRVTGWFGSATDIQDLKRVENDLWVSRERLRITLESAVDYAIITLDAGGLIRGWSKGAELIFGYQEGEVVGLPGDIIFTPEDRANHMPQKEMKTALTEGRALDERWHLRRDGTRFYMSGVMTPILSETLTGFVKVTRDMTDQKAAEEALRLSEERYRIALQSAEMGAWDWNVQSGLVLWNAQLYAMLGLEPEQKEQPLALFLQFLHPDDKDRVHEALEGAVASSGTFHAEFRIIRAGTGEVRWMNGYGRSLTREGGRAARMVGVMHDITARKALEQQKDDFIGIASHELKTPVTSIKAYAEVLREILEERQEHGGAGLLEKLDTQVDRLTDLIRALLDTTRVSEGQLQLHPERFDLNRLIADRAADLQQLSPKHRIIVMAGELRPVMADRERIDQVLTNLISNAVKYSPNGGEVLVTTTDVTDGVQVSVRDQGVGIPEELQQKVFERFFRVRNPQVQTYPGMGLGLYISAGIIQRHGGTIRVESKSGSGSVFHFILPYEWRGGDGPQ